MVLLSFKGQSRITNRWPLPAVLIRDIRFCGFSYGRTFSDNRNELWRRNDYFVIGRDRISTLTWKRITVPYYLCSYWTGSLLFSFANLCLGYKAPTQQDLMYSTGLRNVRMAGEDSYRIEGRSIRLFVLKRTLHLLLWWQILEHLQNR